MANRKRVDWVNVASSLTPFLGLWLIMASTRRALFNLDDHPVDGSSRSHHVTP